MLAVMGILASAGPRRGGWAVRWIAALAACAACIARGDSTPAATPNPLGGSQNFRPLAPAAANANGGAAAEAPDPNALAFDSRLKTYDAKLEDTSADFSFSVTNVSAHEVVITAVKTSCGCTAAALPAQPWHLAPNGDGKVSVKVDLRGKFGQLNKTATLYTSAGAFPLSVRVNVPHATGNQAAMGSRARNLQIAAADRQSVFRGECATCHAQPAKGKSGQALYEAACAVCHDSPNRASMVPDLRKLNHPTDAALWRHWVVEGKPGTLMPAFAASNGGVLDNAQVESLVSYLDTQFKFEVRLPGLTPPVAPVNPGPVVQ